MAMITYPLNDVMYTAEDAELYNCTRSSGVYSGEDFSCTVSGTNNNVTISEGIGWIRNSRFSGKVFANKAPATLALDIADAAYPRIDVIAVRFDAATNSTDFVIKKGEASATPVTPAMTQTEAVYELYLYSIYRPAAAVAIGADDVTDLRLDENYCGLMADAITSVDTSAINAQFTALLAKIKQELADLKVDKIDAYTREETLSPATKTALGLGEDATPDDAFGKLDEINLHWWKRRTEESGYVEETTYTDTANLSHNQLTVYYGDEFTYSNGTYTLTNPVKIDGNYDNYLDFKNAIAGKYFTLWEHPSATLYFAGENSNGDFTCTRKKVVSSYTITAENVTTVTYTKTYYENIGKYEYVSSPNRNAYPDSGKEGIFSYQYLGVPFENAREGAKIGSYAGTGVYGSEANANSLTFERMPKLILMLYYSTGTTSLTLLRSNGATHNYLAIIPSALTTSFVTQNGFSIQGNAAPYAKISEDGKTISWYHTTSAAMQGNLSGHTYYYLSVY